MKLIELCQYTLKQSLCDTGDLYAEYNYEEDGEVLDLNKNGGK